MRYLTKSALSAAVISGTLAIAAVPAHADPNIEVGARIILTWTTSGLTDTGNIDTSVRLNSDLDY